MSGQEMRGIIPAVITPFKDDESIDFTAWQNLLDLLIGSGVHGVFVVGGQGEFFALGEEERTVAVRFCVQTVAGRVPVFANVGAVTTRETIRLAQRAESDGADYLVVITPYYVRPSAGELLEHYIDICRNVRKPVLAYNIPERTGVELTPALLGQVARSQPNFVGLKDSSGRLELVPQWTQGGLRVFIGRDHMIFPGLQLGCVGAVTACANVVPRAFVELYKAFQEGRMEDAVRIQALVEPLRRAFSLGTFPSVIKEAMNLSGLNVGRCRRPVGHLSAEALAQLSLVLDSLRREGYLLQARERVRSQP